MLWSKKKVVSKTIKLVKFGKCYGVTHNGLPVPETITTSLEEAEIFFEIALEQAMGIHVKSEIIYSKTITAIK